MNTYRMKLALNVLLLCLVVSGYSQGIYNNAANIVLTSSSHIYINGNANGGYTSQGAGYINSDGTITLEGNWINNGSTDVYTAIDNTGTTVFGGTTLQQIGGSHLTNFENLTVNNGNKVDLTQNVNIDYNLTLTSGKFDLKDKVADLGTNGDIVSETEINSVTSTDGSGVVGNNTGTIIATRTLNAPSGVNPAHLGIYITTTANLGTIVITRGHEIQTGSFGGSATEGVARYYEIPGIGKLDVGAGISVDMDFWDAEINSLNESQIEGYHWVTEGSSSSWWTPIDGSVNTSTNLFTTTGNPYSSYFTTSTWYGFTWSDKFTLGSKDSPLPIELKEFSATCRDNGKLISWTTASETNNDYFTLEKSDDNKDFYVISTIIGTGNSNVENTYEYFDNQSNENIVYYRLSQTDFNGDEQSFNIISANCSENNTIEDNLIIINNPANESVQLQLTGTENKIYTLSFIDQLGRQLIERKIHLKNTQQKIIINTQNLSEGIYNVVFYSAQKIITKQLIIVK
ncbi:MAG: T9SS type A sorting domain-containing protein [Bacteroidota bacterium]|nr:T9SS type A sorting domain-containing protein [Bacteroidota bacterium]